MIGDALLNNPIWWAQFRLMGGTRKIGVRAGLYAAFIIAAFVLFTRANPGSRVAADARTAVYVIGAIQLLIILLMCTLRTNKAVTHDVEINMIESHRLSPMTGSTAVLGYMIGPSLQPLAFVAVNFVAGLIFCAIAQSWLPTWIAAHLYLAFVALFVWSFIVLLVLCIGKKVNIVTIFVIMFFTGGFKVVQIIPGLALLCGSEMIGYCYEVITSAAASTPPPGAALSVVVQIMVILMWLRAAAHKFERPDLPAFSEFWSVLLYAGWIAVALIGLERADELNLPILGGAFPVGVKLVATLILSMLFLLLPLRSSAVLAHRWEMQHRRLAGRKPVGPLWIAIALTLATVVFLIVIPNRSEWRDLFAGAEGVSHIREKTIWAGLTVLFTAVSVGALYRAACAMRLKAIEWLPVVYLFGTWVLFPILDAVRQTYLDTVMSGHIPNVTFLTSCSPPGGLILSWYIWKDEYWIGLLIQALFCLGALAVYVTAMRRARNRRRSATRHQPSPA